MEYDLCVREGVSMKQVLQERSGGHSFLISENQKKRVNPDLPQDYCVDLKRKHQNSDEIINGRSKWTEMKFVRKQRLNEKDIGHEDTFNFNSKNLSRSPWTSTARPWLPWVTAGSSPTSEKML